MSETISQDPNRSTGLTTCSQTVHESDLKSQPPVNPDFEWNYGSKCDMCTNGEIKGFFHRKYRKHLFVIGILLILSLVSIAAIPVLLVFVNPGISSRASTPYNCPDDITRNAPVEESSIQVRWDEPSGKGIAYQASHQPGDFFEIGNTTVTYNITRGGELLSVCEFSISVLDITPPLITYCPNNVTHKLTTETGPEVTWFEPEATDNSGKVSLVRQNHKPGDVFHVGRTSVEYVYSDPSGNVKVCSFVVRVLDLVPPAVHQCPEDITFYVASEDKLKSVLWVEPKATDNSGQVLLVRQTHRPGEYFPVGSTAVQYVFADPTGNMNMCNFFVKGKISTKSIASRTQTSHYDVLVFSILLTVITKIM